MIGRPRGTRDFTPDEMAIRREVERRIRDVLERYGFEEIATPTFEYAELFTERSGEDILNQLYVFEDKGGRLLALRPELTAPTMRMYSESLQRKPKPVRVYYFENCFRYERPQKGRYREFWQFGVETIGERTFLRTVDTIMAAHESMVAVGLSDVKISLNHITLIRRLLELAVGSEMEVEVLLRTLDKGDTGNFEAKLEEFCPRGSDSILNFFHSPGEESLSKALRSVGAGDGVVRDLTSMLDYLFEVYSTMGELGVENIEIRPGVVRGLDYYDGVVFEIDDKRLGAESQICGGGEYYFTYIGKERMEGVGFAIGFDRLLLSLEERGFPQVKKRNSIYLAVLEGVVGSYPLKVAQTLRGSGWRVDLNEVRGGLRKALTTALKRGYRWIVVVGDEEARENKVLYRDLERRIQMTLRMEEIPHAIPPPS